MNDITRLIGFVGQREGFDAWRPYFDDNTAYPGAIPIERVEQLMDYPLREAEVYYQYQVEDDGGNPGGMMKGIAHGRKAIVRGDTGDVLGIFKNGYQIHQPKEWLVQNLQNLLDSGLQVGAATLLRRGAIAIVQAENPDTRESAEGVKFRPYISAATSHDGSLSTRYFTGSLVVVCENQLGVLRSDKDAIKVRHSANSRLRINEARTRLDLMLESVGDEMDQSIRELTSQYITDQQFEEIVQAFTGEEKLADKGGRAYTIANNRATKLRELWNNDDRVAPWRNSAWGALSAFNTASNHEFTNQSNVDKRFERNQIRAIDGTWSQFDQNVLRMLEAV